MDEVEEKKFEFLMKKFIEYKPKTTTAVALIAFLESYKRDPDFRELVEHIVCSYPGFSTVERLQEAFHAHAIFQDHFTKLKEPLSYGQFSDFYLSEREVLEGMEKAIKTPKRQDGKETLS